MKGIPLRSYKRTADDNFVGAESIQYSYQGPGWQTLLVKSMDTTPIREKNTGFYFLLPAPPSSSLPGETWELQELLNLHP